MTLQTITLNLPDVIHKQLAKQARAKTRPIEEAALQALTRNLPPPVEDDLPAALRAELLS
jgi:hypothetical protein